MNIFILDYDVKTNAFYHCDQHVNKMILESAQMICTVASEYNIKVPYKPTHANHPCTKWVRESLDNYIYLLDLAFWLNEASKDRYNKKTNHKSWDLVSEMEVPKLPSKGLTKFARAMPEEFKKLPDTVDSYRAYYRTKVFATWKSKTPDWMFNGSL
jgi:hypothetical protein